MCMSTMVDFVTIFAALLSPAGDRSERNENVKREMKSSAINFPLRFSLWYLSLSR